MTETSRSNPRVKVPPGQGWTTSRKRVLRGRSRGQPWPRSVDSECAGREIEPRNARCRGGRRRLVRRKATPLRQSVGHRPKVLAQRLHRGLRPGHVRKGCPGTWEISRRLRRRRTERNRRARAQRSEARARERRGSRSAAVGAMKRGNRPEGPCGAKGGTGSRNRWRER